MIGQRPLDRTPKNGSAGDGESDPFSRRQLDEAAAVEPNATDHVPPRHSLCLSSPNPDYAGRPNTGHSNPDANAVRWKRQRFVGNRRSRLLCYADHPVGITQPRVMPTGASQPVRRAQHPSTASVQNVGVDHRRSHALVTEHLLNRPDSGPRPRSAVCRNRAAADTSPTPPHSSQYVILKLLRNSPDSRLR